MDARADDRHAALWRGLILIVVLALAVGGFWLVRGPGDGAAAAGGVPGDAPVPQVGQLAPDFRGRTLEGAEITLAEQRGHPVWLTFGASWCAGCRAEAPDIEAAHRAAKDSGVRVIAIYLSEDAPAVKAYADKVGMSYVQVPDPDGRICRGYGARAVPMHVFVDAQGKVAQVHHGVMTADQMRAALTHTGASLR